MGDLAETLEALAVCDEALGSLRAELEQLPVSIDLAETRDAETRARLEAERQSFADFEHARREKEAQSLASLTGWDINAIRSKMKLEIPEPTDDEKWWKRLWN